MILHYVVVVFSHKELWLTRACLAHLLGFSPLLPCSAELSFSLLHSVTSCIGPSFLFTKVGQDCVICQLLLCRPLILFSRRAQALDVGERYHDCVIALVCASASMVAVRISFSLIVTSKSLFSFSYLWAFVFVAPCIGECSLRWMVGSCPCAIVVKRHSTHALASCFPVMEWIFVPFSSVGCVVDDLCSCINATSVVSVRFRC